MEQFGRLTLLRELLERSGDGHKVGLWQCSCGKTCTVIISRVRNGYTKSCGCLSAEISKKVNTKHGKRNSPEYSSWQAMVNICHAKTSKDFERYGGRGIKVCDPWRRSFESFYEHIGPRPKGTTIDRIDPYRGYEPGNVRWATPKEQARNRRDLVVVDTPEGRMPLVDYAKIIGLSKGAAHLRFKRGQLKGVSHV